MTARPRFRSLFWSFAAAFLVVLVVAAVLQGIMIAVVLRPLMDYRVTQHAGEVADEVARRIEAAGRLPEDGALRDAMTGRQVFQGEIRIFFRRPDGSVVLPRRLPPQMEERMGRRLFGRDSLQVGREVSAEFAPPPGGPEGKGRPGGPGDGPRSRRRPGADLEGPPRGDRGRPVYVIRALRTVTVGTEVLGHVVAIAPREHGSLLRSLLHPRLPRPIVLFLPVAVLVAGVAGLVMFRALTRRLRELEVLATRVTEGDLEARVADPKGDEIGRLGDRLNRMIERLAAARRSLEESDLQRRRLLADISHELGTPLTSIRGYTETMLDPGVSVSEGEREEYLHSVLEESKRMDLLIQDLLELTRLEAGAVELETERLDWTALCRNTIERFQERFREAGIAVAWTGDSEPAWVRADGRRLEQVLENLLVNTLRYVPAHGRVTVSLEPVAGAGRPGYRLTVADDGPGVPPADLPGVFERFYRAAADRTVTGSGLGLAIVKEIVLRHGGAVSAVNREPTGLAIRVELPAEGSGDGHRGT